MKLLNEITSFHLHLKQSKNVSSEAFLTKWKPRFIFFKSVEKSVHIYLLDIKSRYTKELLVYNLKFHAFAIFR